MVVAGAHALGCTKAFEAPVRIRHAFPNSVDPSAVCRILLDTIAVSNRRHILDTYRLAGDRIPLA